MLQTFQVKKVLVYSDLLQQHGNKIPLNPPFEKGEALRYHLLKRGKKFSPFVKGSSRGFLILFWLN
jgi:hypothetical protein